MRVTLFAVLLFLLSSFTLVQAQRSTLDLVGGVDYAYRILQGPDSLQAVLDSRDAGESPRLTGRFGINYAIRLTPRTWLKTGLRYVEMGYRYHNDDLRFGIDPTTGSTTDPSGITDITIRYKYQFISVPLAVRHQFSDKKLSPYLELGVAPQWLRDAYTTFGTNISDPVRMDDDPNFDYTKFHVSGFLAAGLNYQLSAQWQGFIQPTLRYHFTGSTIDTPIEEHLYSIGLELGLRRML